MLCSKYFIFLVGVLVSARTDKLFYSETFDNEDPFVTNTWIKSKDSKYENQPIAVKLYDKPLPGYENDKGLKLTQEMKYYGVGSSFPAAYSFTDQDFVFQYELKLEESLICGGAYVKLLRESKDLNLELLNNETPYVIMFGPDRCGANNKIHFIIQYKNPLNGEYSEKHFNTTIPMKTDGKVHLYTLHIKNNNDFSIYIDKKKESSGNLLTHLSPPINPSTEIIDETDVKPLDWVDEEYIIDPEAVKPDDWDESEPEKITDPKATIPKGWDESAPDMIPDDKASKPEDWDDEEDGEWEAPLIANPICDNPGCGKWVPPKIKNPLYKGKWTPPKIKNPDFKGVWSPRLIKNPNYYFDPNPFKSLDPIGAIAVEVWTTNAGILYDDFAIAYALNDAFDFADSTYIPKSKAEKIN